MPNPSIISRPDLLGGKPCVRGTRISVEFILELLAGGASREQILAVYPSLTEAGLTAALRFAATRVRRRSVMPRIGRHSQSFPAFCRAATSGMNALRKDSRGGSARAAHAGGGIGVSGPGPCTRAAWAARRRAGGGS